MNNKQKEQIEALRKKKSIGAKGGGDRRIQQQHEKGRMTARERVHELLDPDSFVEMNMLAALPEHSDKDLYGDGVVAGYGKIDGRGVCIFSQDYTVLAGTTGPIHRSKITGTIDMAVKTGVPVICLWDSAGGRLDLENRPIPLSRSSIFFRHEVERKSCPKDNGTTALPICFYCFQ